MYLFFIRRIRPRLVSQLDEMVQLIQQLLTRGMDLHWGVKRNEMGHQHGRKENQYLRVIETHQLV